MEQRVSVSCRGKKIRAAWVAASEQTAVRVSNSVEGADSSLITLDNKILILILCFRAS